MKDKNKFKLHLCVSNRRDLVPRPMEDATPPPEFKEPLLKKKTRESLIKHPYGFLPFRYEKGRGLPPQLALVLKRYVPKSHCH